MRLINVVGRGGFVALFVLFLMVSCGGPSATDSQTTITEMPKNSTDTTLVPQSTTTVSPAQFPSQTPSPTLSSTQDVEITIRELYAHNGGCELPCLWGIVPGKTLIQDVYDNFSRIGYFDNITRAVDAFQIVSLTISPPSDLISLYDDESWSFLMRVENGVIEGIVTRTTVVEKFSTPSLAAFLTHFGRPDEIRVRVIESQGEDPDYEIALFYPNKGIFIIWRGDVVSVVTQTDENITVMACPQSIPTEADVVHGLNPPTFYLFSPNEKMLFDEIIEKHLSEEPAGTYQLLDKAEVENLYTMYLASTVKDCFTFHYSFVP